MGFEFHKGVGLRSFKRLEQGKFVEESSSLLCIVELGDCHASISLALLLCVGC